MRRRLFLHAGSAAALLGLTACGGGGGGAGIGAEASVDSQAGAGAAPAVAAGGSGLPSKIMAVYYTSWDTGSYKITDVPQDFNVIYLFHAKPNGKNWDGSYNNAGDGSFMFEHYDSVTPEQIQACRARGQRVILTAGGAGAGFAFDDRTKSQNFIASVKDMYTRLGGVDGIDFNNYEASIVGPDNVAAVTAEMIWIAGQLKSIYGAGFAITSPPQPNAPEQQSLIAAMAKAGVLDYAGPQFYDWSGFNEPGYIKGRMDTWMKQVGDASKMVVGLSGGYSNGPSLDDCVREWDAVKAAYPGIRGMFCWCAQTELADGSGWVKTMKARI